MRRRKGRKCLLRELESCYQQIDDMSEGAGCMVAYMMVNIWNAKGKDITRLRKLYTQVLQAYFMCETKEEMNDIAKMLKGKKPNKKAVKAAKDETSK